MFIKLQNYSFHFFILFFSFFSSYICLKAQQITGTIKDNFNENVINVKVLFKNNKLSANYQEFVLSNNGFIDYTLIKDYDTLYIEIKALGYEFQSIEIINPIKNKKYNFDFILEKIEGYELKEVIVTAKEKPFTTKEDTVSYNVSSYADGSERKIEEVIKKLPGVEVNDQTGEIKYKGKSVETVTLDGDNLFGFNYTLGTKNINVDMVEQIEAIDNYSENPLLKGIEQGGKVSLNLKLKKGKMDLSGNVDYGSGWFQGGKQSFNLNSNILGVTKTYKSFATLAYNNIGINHSPFDYFGFSLNMEQIKEQDYFAEKIIPETRFFNLLDDNRSNINNQTFANYNAIFKLHPKFKIKTNLYFVNDKIQSIQLFENQYDINNDKFITSDLTQISKKPVQGRADVEIKYITSKTSLLEYNLRVKQENITTPSITLQNQIESYHSDLMSKDYYLKQDLLWTKKLAEKQALQLSLFYSKNDVSQNFQISPSVFNANSEYNIQESHFAKIFAEGKATYLGSGKKDKYVFTLGGYMMESPFKSQLKSDLEVLDQNNFGYRLNNFYSDGVYNINRGKWQISPSYTLKFVVQNLNQTSLNQMQRGKNLVLEPALHVKYKLNSISFLSANWGWNQNTNSEQYFFLNPVLINNRTLINNQPDIDLRKNQSLSLLYYINDLYNQFQLNTGISYQISEGNFFSNQTIDENISEILYFYLPQKNDQLSLNFNTSKYVSFFESTFKLSGSYNLSHYQNIVNNSQLRKNESRFFNYSIFWKTAFDIFINFENTFTQSISNTKSKNQNAFQNKSIQNSFSIILKPSNRWFIHLSTDYYLPDTKSKNQNFFFLDAVIRYKPKSKKWESSLLLRNLTNEVNFEQINTSDISTSIFKSNLLLRNILLSLTYNF